MQVVKVSHLSKSYGNNLVLDDISFELKQAGIVALVGPNGSGKSTLLNIISNLIPHKNGSIEIFGCNHRDESVFHQMSYLKDNRILYSYLTGWDHLSFAASVYGLDQERVEEVVNQLNINSYVKRKTGDYSLGMKQMLLLALAILNQPPLLILDEPLNGLDPSRILEVRELLRNLAAEGTTIVMSSHSLLEIEALTNHILFLKDGKLFVEILDAPDSERLELKYQSYYPRV